MSAEDEASEPRGGAGLEPWNLALGALILALDYAFKRFVAGASASELDFLLGPTAALVELFTGHAFVAETGAGYVSREAHLIIAPACSGANFAIIAFTSLGVGFLGTFSSPARKLVWLPVAASAAYAVTLLTNAARIALALGAAHDDAFSGLFSSGGLHRAIGVATYLGALLALHAGTERALRLRRGERWFPLGCYVAVTLVTPLLGGARAYPAFISHAAVVLGATTLAAAVLWLVHRSDGRKVTRTIDGGRRHARISRGVAPARRGRERSLSGQGDAALVPRPLA